ncbi:DUF7507 domain-containing protein [Nonomuraea turcica]|uniref:DUF7507 domain-containing protein n=1 Tax=Nonomuraea sp. G32 TaxID=3067274 RepID=UPI00273B4A1E|nr:hypothetical protein [Nonomuraea sp. G32]MDP4511225.1 hypothetical protein [Nonomuraea sp. G32]
MAILLALAAAMVAGAVPATAATVEVTVHLYRVVELSCDEGAGEACGNDYYPKFEVDHQGLFDGSDTYCCAHGDDFRTNWVYKKTVDTSHNPVRIQMQLWDQDDLSFDDPIRWTKGGSATLDLDFNLDTCVFTGGGLTTQQGANAPTLAGESEGSGEDSARGYFTITTPDCLKPERDADSDGDSLMNSWETAGRGINVDNDGTIDLALGEAPYNAVPYRKDLFVEADYMKGQKPQAGALDDVVKAFDAAPVDPYPDPADPSKVKYRGIALHAMEGEEMPNVPNIKFSTSIDGDQNDFNDFKNGNPVVKEAGKCSGRFGTQADRTSPNCVNILEARRKAFRYMIFAHTYEENSDSSGRAEIDLNTLVGGNDFIVTLGSWSSFTNVGGRKNAEAATFMHELGHTLSLGHGGDDSVNCKPNYLSVMNYTLQFTNRDPARHLDYSNATKGTVLLTQLREQHLNENNGVYGTPNPARNIVYGVGGKIRTATATNGPIDWNEKDGNTESDIPADINWIEAVKPGCDVAKNDDVLTGHDDWSHLQYDPKIHIGFFGDGPRLNLPEELTEQAVLAMTQKADLKVSKSADQAEAAGGDTVGYTVAVTNLGPGTATAIQLTDTLPDGSKQQRSLPDLADGAVNTVTPKFTYQVPCATPDGTVLTNSVTVTGTDTDGVPDPAVSDNTAQAKTTVQAPVLTAALSATPAVNAGEAITYTLTYANTGGGAASNVVATVKLPAGVYYSKALDQGTGPKPSEVTPNADGSTTLTWKLTDVPAKSGDRVVTFTARPTLLALAGTAYAAEASLSYRNATGACTFDPVTGSATTTITVVPPTRDPRSKGFWKTHEELWTAEFLARVQATDQRYDADQDGALSPAEATAAFTGDNAPKSVLQEHLLGTYLNLSTRRINAGTVITSPVGGTVREAVLEAHATLLLPVDSSTSARYSRIIDVLNDVNANRIEVY